MKNRKLRQFSIAYIRRHLLSVLSLLLFFGTTTIAPAEGFYLKRGVNVFPLFGVNCYVQRLVTCHNPLPIIDDVDLRHRFHDLKAAGIDFLRIPIDPTPFVISVGAKREALIKRISQFVKIVVDEKLTAVVDIHPPGADLGYQELIDDPDLYSRFSSLMGDISVVLTEVHGSDVILELMNEPTSSCNDSDWPTRRLALYSEVRKRAPKLPIVIGGSCWNALDSLILIDPSNYDDNTIYTFHYYQPDTFTHQAATWRDDIVMQALTGLRWPASSGTLAQAAHEIEAYVTSDPRFADNKEEIMRKAIEIANKYINWNPSKEIIITDFSRVAAWADLHKIPHERIMLGEFGVLKRERKFMGADIDSASHWLEDVRKTAENNGFAWAMWSYSVGMALTKEDGGYEFYPEIIRALGLKEPNN